MFAMAASMARPQSRLARGLNAMIADEAQASTPSLLDGPEAQYPLQGHRPHANIMLHQTSSHLLLEPRSAPKDERWLCVDRSSAHIALMAAADARKAAAVPEAVATPIYGAVGVLDLLAGPYLAVITEAALLGRVLGAAVLHCHGVRLVAFKGDGALGADALQTEHQCRTGWAAAPFSSATAWT